jgi:3'-phosphoadenosine 5'-phosphosulfate sulfotransferase
VQSTERDAATILKSQRLNQGSFRAAGYNIDTHGLARRLRESRGVYDPSEPDPEAEGWESSEPVETSRLENQEFWLTTLRRRNDEPFKTSIDWMEPFLNIEAMVAAQRIFGRMWLYEIEAIKVPRNWLRWAVRFARTAAKLEVGNPRDEQLACYLPDTDLFITNDRRFMRILESVVEAAPTTVATVRHAGIKKETPSVTAAIEAIADTWTATQPT